MSTKNKLQIFLLCLCSFTLVHCTDDFEDLNQNDFGISQEVLEQDFNHIKALFPALFLNIYQITPGIEWGYQIQTGLQGDIWSGYMATPTPFAANSNNSHYNLINGWNSYAWNLYYQNILPNTLSIAYGSKDKYPQFYAISLILKTSATHKMLNTYGPIIYSSFESPSPEKPYDSEAQVHDKLFTELDEAMAILNDLISNNTPSSIVTIDNSYYNGDYTKWAKYTNSLRLRMAMRIVKADPNKAKIEAEKALNNPHGLIIDNADNMIIKIPNTTHPINTISNSWGDIRMGADIESIMTGYQDPRIETYFQTSEDFPDKYKGVRTGIDILTKSDRVGFSKIGEIVNRQELVLFNAAETYFLIAEAALRSWDTKGIIAKTAYENGIKASFIQHNAPHGDTYLNDTANLALNYIDPVDSDNNHEAVNLVSIKWSPNDNNEIKLQKIITQKWIALFPDGHEAWAEWRRTGYPKLFQIERNMSGGIIPSELGVRRLNFPQSEYDTNSKGINTGLELLNGPDNGATRLWWDTTEDNF